MSATIESPRSPFVNAESFEPESPARSNGRLAASSPFVEAFALEGTFDSAEPSDAREAARRVLLAELYDNELDEALYEVVSEATGLVSGARPSRLDAAALELHFAPLAEEVESAIQRVADHFGERDPASVTEAELDDVLRSIVPQRQLTPAFEQLFGGLRNVVKKVASGAANLAKKGVQAAATLGLGPILAQLKGLVRPLLDRVLKAAIDRLPVALQPVARTLADRLRGSVLQSELDAEDEAQEPAVDVSAIQHELDEQVADLLMGERAAAYENETAGWGSATYAGEGGLADLDAARERFVADLEALRAGDGVAPAVERFVPAILPALRLGIRLAGRKRVVSLLAGLVSKLISRFVGPASAGALSTALVDAGLKLLSLEMADADQRRTPHAAVAATLEDTVRAVAALPDTVLDNEALLEGSIVRAFENAATANLPPLLSRAIYRRRPELIETDQRRGAWVPLPLRGPKRYKKFTRVIRTRITPRVAMAIPIFGDAPLALFLHEQLGLEPGEELEADVHLYEAMPGMLLGDVARGEANGGAISADEFHPLTAEAAALLVGEPGLGRKTAAASAAPHRMTVGQRFYRIAVPGRRVLAVPAAGARRQPRRRTTVQLALDFPGDRVRLHVFLSERRAQELAAALRKNAHAGAVAATLRDIVDRGVAGAVSGNVTGRVRIVHEALAPSEARGPGLRRLPAAAVRSFTARIGEWALSALTDFLGKQSPRFIAATEDAQDGVTVSITMANPPGMAALRSGLAGAGARREAAPNATPPAVQVDVAPGFVGV